MNSEGSRDTKDWSNDAENSVLHYSNKLYYIKIEVILYCNIIYCYF